QNTTPTQITHTKTSSPLNMKTGNQKYDRTVLLSFPKAQCKFCSGTGHSIYHCFSFKALSAQNKYDFVKEKHFCFNCLGSAHSVKECKSKNVCTHCHKKHHSWLHLPSRTADNLSESIPLY